MRIDSLRLGGCKNKSGDYIDDLQYTWLLFMVNHCASKLLALVDLMDFIFEQNEESDMEHRIS